MKHQGIAIATSSVYPNGVDVVFEAASAAGATSVEVMVSQDVISQSVDSLRNLIQKFQIPVTSIHAPCLLATARVWGNDPIEKLNRSIELAEAVGAQTVVVHPGFRWQREYVQGFFHQVQRLNAHHEAKVAVENMYPVRTRFSTTSLYGPSWNVFDISHDFFVLDTSHASVAQQNIVQLWQSHKSKIRQIHLSDATGRSVDEHLVPGRGTLPLRELLLAVASDPDLNPDIILEVNTTKEGGKSGQIEALREAVLFVKSCQS